MSRDLALFHRRQTSSTSVRSVGPIAVAVGTKVIAVRPTRVEKGRLPCSFGLQAPCPAVDLIPASAGAAATVLGAVSSAPHSAGNNHGGWLASDAWSYRTATHAGACISSIAESPGTMVTGIG